MQNISVRHLYADPLQRAEMAAKVDVSSLKVGGAEAVLHSWSLFFSGVLVPVSVKVLANG